MNIFGEKTILRAIEKQDNIILKEMINDPQTEMMLGGNSFPISTESQENWFASLKNNPHELRCIVADKNAPDIAIGTVILSDIDYINGNAQIHIKLTNNEKVRRKGYGSDAISAITKYAFSFLRLHCIYAEVISYNEPSQKMFLKCNYQREGTLKSRIFKQGTYWDVVVYSKQNEEN